MSFIERIFTQAKSNKKRIILPEATDIRILEAASQVTRDGIADIVLLGDADEVNKLAAENNIDISASQVVDYLNSPNRQRYADAYYEMRKHKGVSPEDALAAMDDETYFACMMLKQGEADGIVSGAVNSTAQTLSPALRIIKTAPDAKLVSAFFIMQVPNSEYGEDGLFAFGDSGMVEDPNVEQLSEIAIQTAESFEALSGHEAKVAMLSYSTKGSARSHLTEKVIEATKLAQEKAPGLKLDGELQLDAAIVPDIGAKKAPGSDVAGTANVLIFPNLDAGNIGYKLVQRLANADAYGPLTQGLAAPINDLSRGSTVDDILGVIGITAVQAQNLEVRGE